MLEIYILQINLNTNSTKKLKISLYWSQGPHSLYSHNVYWWAILKILYASMIVQL